MSVKSSSARREEPWTQLATRIPRDLRRRLKLYCVTNDIAVRQFVVDAIREKLGRMARAKGRRSDQQHPVHGHAVE